MIDYLFYIYLINICLMIKSFQNNYCNIDFNLEFYYISLILIHYIIIYYI